MNFEAIYSQQPFLDQLWKTDFNLEELAKLRLVCKKWRNEIDNNELWQGFAKQIGLPDTVREIGYGRNEILKRGVWRRVVYWHIRHCSRYILKKDVYPTISEVTLWIKRLNAKSLVLCCEQMISLRSYEVSRFLFVNRPLDSLNYDDVAVAESIELLRKAVQKRFNSFSGNLFITNALPISALELLAGFTSLTRLTIQVRSLVAVPNLSCFIQLKVLSLTFGAFYVIPPEIEELTNLEELRLGYNKISLIEADLSRLIKLKTLNLRKNKLSHTIFEQAFPSSLRKLKLDDNIIGTVGSSIANLTQVRSLHLDRCMINRMDPNALSKLTKLRRLSLRENLFDEIPLGIRHIRSVDLTRNPMSVLRDEPKFFDRRHIALDGVQLRSIPSWIGKYTRMTHLNLSTNALIELPSELSSLVALRELNIAANSFKTFPEVVFKLTTLRFLDLSQNPSIFATDAFKRLSDLVKLGSLTLNNNKLEELPMEFASLRRLWKLQISSNKFEFVPEVIFNLRRLRWLFLGDNPIIALPDSITRLTKLRIDRD